MMVTNKVRIARTEALNEAISRLEAARDRAASARCVYDEAVKISEAEAKVIELQRLTRKRYVTERGNLDYAQCAPERVNSVETINALLEDDARCTEELAALRRARRKRENDAKSQLGTAEQQLEEAGELEAKARKIFYESFPVLEVAS